MSPNLKQCLDKIYESPPVDIDSVDFSFVNPTDVVVDAFGDTLFYDGATERRVEVDAGFEDMVRLMVPNASEPQSNMGLYLPGWRRHESAHADVAETAQRELGLEPFSDFPSDIPLPARWAGKLAVELPWFEPVTEAVILMQGTRNEKLTFDHYTIERNKYVRMGEVAFAETAVVPMRYQESLHLAFNKVALKEKVEELTTAQLQVASAVDAALWQPVGAKSRQLRPALKAAVEEMADGAEEEMQKMSHRVQEVVDKIIGVRLPKRRRQEFVAKRIMKYMKESGDLPLAA